MKAVTLIVVVFFSTSFYSDAPNVRTSEQNSLRFSEEIKKLQCEGKKGYDEFQLINIKIDSLCKSYEKL